MDKCTSIFGHRFEARYNDKEPKWMERIVEANGNIQEHYLKEYVCDICVRCGLVINRGGLT